MTLAIVALAAVVLVYLAHRYTSKPVDPSAAGGALIGQSVPDFSLKDIRGNTFRMSELKGKVVILDFWATYCGPCQIEIPWFTDIYKRYRAQGLEVVGVDMGEDLDTVRPFVEKREMNYRVVMGNDDVATQFGGVFGLPTTFIIGRDGKIVSQHVGLVARDTFEEGIKKLL